MNRLLLTAGSEFEAQIVRERLSQAGIPALLESEGNPRAIAAGARDILVAADRLEEARDALRSARDVDDDELENLSQEAVPANVPTRVPGTGSRLWKTVLRRGRKDEGTEPPAGSSSGP